MIIGNGLLASAFRDAWGHEPSVVVFASGVSNSREVEERAFLREENLLKEAVSLSKHLVYFSTCSIYDPSLGKTPYVLHKKRMEELVVSSKRFSLFRHPQAVGMTSNPNTLANYLCTNIMRGSHFVIWRDAKRNLIDVVHAAAIISNLIRTGQCLNMVLNVGSPIYILVPELVRIFETVLRKKANYELASSGSAYIFDTTEAENIASRIGIRFHDRYVEELISKYYAPK